MRIARFAWLFLASSCSSCPYARVGLGEPWVENREQGIPKAIFGDPQVLLDDRQPRLCQMVFEPAFSARHAVWFVQDSPQSNAVVIVRVQVDAGVQSFSAPLDAGTAARLARLCLATLTADFASCERRGRDGVWYHSAHPKPSGGYVMASFWSPSQGTIADALVRIAEALRDYATLPEALRPRAWVRLQESEMMLSEILVASGAG